MASFSLAKSVRSTLRCDVGIRSSASCAHNDAMIAMCQRWSLSAWTWPSLAMTWKGASFTSASDLTGQQKCRFAARYLTDIARRTFVPSARAPRSSPRAPACSRTRAALPSASSDAAGPSSRPRGELGSWEAPSSPRLLVWVVFSTDLDGLVGEAGIEMSLSQLAATSRVAAKTRENRIDDRHAAQREGTGGDGELGHWWATGARHRRARLGSARA
jgi:hypothetical protein